jgi:hypothetical protein
VRRSDPTAVPIVFASRARSLAGRRVGIAGRGGADGGVEGAVGDDVEGAVGDDVEGTVGGAVGIGGGDVGEVADETARCERAVDGRVHGGVPRRFGVDRAAVVPAEVDGVIVVAGWRLAAEVAVVRLPCGQSTCGDHDGSKRQKETEGERERHTHT